MENNTQNQKLVYTNQIKAIIECLKSPAARKQALEIILGLIESKELTDIFIEIELPKIMIRLVENEDIKEKDIIIQILINLSTNEKYLDSFLKLNTFHRILSIVFHLIKTELNKEEKTYDNVDDLILDSLDNNPILKNGQEFNVNFEFEKYVINSSKVTDPHGMENETYINLYFMFLANLTSYENGQKYILDLHCPNEKSHGIIFFKLLDKFFEFIHHNSFNFCSAIISNVSCLKEGRELILSNNLFKIFLILFDKMNNMKITNILRLIRNCAFEYEKYIDLLLEKDSILYIFLIKLICDINQEKNTKLGVEEIDKIYFENFKVDELNDEEKEIINDLIIDILLVLSNDKKGVEEMKKKNVNEYIKRLEEKLKEKCKTNETLEKMKDRLMVIKQILDN